MPGADLKGAVLTDAMMKENVLSGADCRGANFAGAPALGGCTATATRTLHIYTLVVNQFRHSYQGRLFEPIWNSNYVYRHLKCVHRHTFMMKTVTTSKGVLIMLAIFEPICNSISRYI